MKKENETEETVMEEKSTKKNDGGNQKVSFHKLFSFADNTDFTLMTVGTIAAVGNGLTQPFMTLIFGQLINAFGTTDPDHMVKEVWKVRVFFLYFIIIILEYLLINLGLIRSGRTFSIRKEDLL